MRYLRHAAGLFCMLALATFMTAAAQPVPLIQPKEPRLSVLKEFSFDEKTRKSVSGIACESGTGSERKCLVVFDEGVQAHFATLTQTGLRAANATRPLLDKVDPETLKKLKELDSEGAAFDGAYIYVTGSHSVKRKTCEKNVGSQHLIRFKAAWATGAVQIAEAQDIQVSDKLQPLLSSLPGIKEHVGGCLSDKKPLPPNVVPGVNIEGLAVRAGRIHLGFRSPTIDGTAWIFSVATESMFGSAPPTPVPTPLPLGPNLGIRDMASGASTILLLVGPDDRGLPDSAKWFVWEWKDLSSGAARPLAQLDLSAVKFEKCAPEIKPEAITVLEENSSAYKVVVLSDGVCDGGPLLFEIPK